MLSDFIRTRKGIIGIIIILLIASLIFFTITFITRIGKEPAHIYLAPGDAHLTINDKEYRPGDTYIEPGTYEVKAEKEGFESYQETVEITQPNNTDIDIALAPLSDEARKWRQNNMEAYLAYEGRAGAKAAAEGAIFNEKNPVTDQLPFQSYIYTIGYRADPDKQDGIILTITAITGYREAALEKIREFGFDPTDYKIDFNNYENPFSHE